MIQYFSIGQKLVDVELTILYEIASLEIQIVRKIEVFKGVDVFARGKGAKRGVRRREVFIE